MNSFFDRLIKMGFALSALLVNKMLALPSPPLTILPQGNLSSSERWRQCPLDTYSHKIASVFAGSAFIKEKKAEEIACFQIPEGRLTNSFQ